MEHIIFHVDVNSAYLAWNAVWELNQGHGRDLRTIPSVVGGDPENRRGVVLAKSHPAKNFGIITGESLFTALAKCPQLTVVPARFNVYVKASDAMAKILARYTNSLERYSIDECFLDMGVMKRDEALRKAHEIRHEIHDRLGFTVNVGIGTNKLTAKMASDFQKPDLVHTLYPEEIKTKFHPLPIEELFMVGPALAKKLRNINITTIHCLAHCDAGYIAEEFGKIGMMIWNFAWGIDDAPIQPEGSMRTKGMGHSTTLPHDLTEREDCHRTIVCLLETLVERLKASQFHTTCVSVHYTTSIFKTRSRQRMLTQQTDSMAVLYEVSCQLFDQLWQGQPLRKIGISFTHLRSNKVVQLSMLDFEEIQKKIRLDGAVSEIRQRFGDNALFPARFVCSDSPPPSDDDEPEF